MNVGENQKFELELQNWSPNPTFKAGRFTVVGHRKMTGVKPAKERGRGKIEQDAELGILALVDESVSRPMSFSKMIIGFLSNLLPTENRSYFGGMVVLEQRRSGIDFSGY